MVSYGQVNRAVKSWAEECVLTADEIFHSTKKPIYVCMSGGIDSEVVAESFRKSGHPFTAAIMRISDSLNEHDISWAIKYCQQHKIAHVFFDVNVQNFYQSEEFKKISESTKCFYPMLTLQMKLMSWVANQGGFPVVGSAECYLEKQISGTWVMYEREIYASLYRYQLENNLEGVAGFFQWNPENMLSFLTDPTVEALVKNKFPDAKSSLSVKQEIYQKHFNIVPRPKYYGWEGFSDLEGKLRQSLSEKFKAFAQEAKTPYSKVIEILSKSNLRS